MGRRRRANGPLGGRWWERCSSFFFSHVHLEWTVGVLHLCCKLPRVAFNVFKKKLYAHARSSPHPASGAAMPLCDVQCYRRGGAQAMVVRLPLFVTPSQRSFAAAFAITL